MFGIVQFRLIDLNFPLQCQIQRTKTK